jgi:hypothetical protein
MPATLRSIKGKVAEITICLEPDKPVEERTPDDFFTLQYRQHNLTGKVEAAAREAVRDDRALEALCEMCAPVFVKWDLKPGATEEQMEALETAMLANDLKEVERLEKEIKDTVAFQKPIPITKESLMEHVPATVLSMILDQIGESRSPNQKTGES